MLGPGRALGSLRHLMLELGLRGAFWDVDPLNRVPFKRARSRVKKGPLEGVSLILARTRMIWAIREPWGFLVTTSIQTFP